jgi:glycosyltransferase involved in cell wall biosynthesis
VRIALVAPGLGVGGAERIVVDLAVRLRASGRTVTVVAPRGPLEDELEAAGVPHRPVGERGRSRLGAALTTAELVRVLRSQAPDLVHAHNPKMTALACAARRLLPPGRRPVEEATPHGGEAAEDRAAARLLRRADHLVCVSDDLRSRMVAGGCAPEATQVIRNGTRLPAPLDDATRMAFDRELGLEDPVVTVVGRLVPVKGVEQVVRAAALLVDAVPSARLLVVGDGPQRAALERLAGDEGVAAAVRFTGVRQDAAALIARSTVVVLASRSEGVPLVALEAMAAGVPVVAPRVGGMEDLLSTGAGVLMEDTTPTAIAAAVLPLLASEAQRRRMGEAGQARVGQRHGLEQMLEAHDALYARLVGGRS